MRSLAPIAISAALLASCSIQKLAVNSLGDALASGDSVYESDNDPILVGQALPFSLKLIESLLSQQPEHQGLLLAAAKGYVFYSYAYISQIAQSVSGNDIDAARVLRARARNLYLRALDFANQALALDYPNVQRSLRQDPDAAVQLISSHSDQDLELLYWNAAALGLAISASRNEPGLLARLPEVEALLGRALELNEAWDNGALHEFAIQISSVSDIGASELEGHYRRALELSLGRRASLYIAYAEADAVRRQDRAAFIDLLSNALAVDIEAEPNLRLVNVIAQQRADWLLSNVDQLFLE